MHKIRELRNQRGISQEELADRINVKPVLVSSWEKNHTSIEGKYLIRLAKFFGVTGNELLGLKKTERQHIK
jgi:transcriptional regulator with XRE-family HTH domain